MHVMNTSATSSLYPSARQTVGSLLIQLERELKKQQQMAGNPLATEALHDYRTTLRKTRSLLARMEGVLKDKDLRRYRKGFKLIMHKTGPVRDTQVCLPRLTELLNSDPEVAPCIAIIRQHMARIHTRQMRILTRYLASLKHDHFMQSWANTLKEMSAGSEGSDPDMPLDRFVRRAIKHHWRIMRKEMNKSGKLSAETLHSIRRHGKDLRYFLEAFGNDVKSEPRQKMRKLLKRMQNELGALQDQRMMYQLLREFGKDRVDAPELKRLLQYVKSERRAGKQKVLRLINDWLDHADGCMQKILE